MRVFYVLLGCLLLYGCSDSENAANAVDFRGAYVFSQAPSKDTLFIEGDSTYRHRFWSTRGEMYETVGNWSYNQQIKEIHFEDFTFFNDSGPIPPSGNWFSKVRILDKNIDLIYSLENNIYYRRKALSKE